MLNEIKETMDKELKKIRKQCMNKIKTLIKREKLCKGTKQILELKSIVNEIKNSLQELNGRSEQVEKDQLT